MIRRLTDGRNIMQTTPHSPTDGIYPADDYVHAMEVRGAERFLFVAGTMGLDPDGVPGADVATQLDLIWSNLRTILASAGLTVDNIVRLTSYLRDASYAEANAKARLAALGGRRIPTTAIVAQTLESSWLVEIEVIAAA
jgi:2-iminobutanoate/2-iminopropanoate deaminase